MWHMDKDYMKKHLASYIEFQLSQGYEMLDIRQALLRYGYDDKLLDEICETIEPSVHQPVGNLSIKELNEDLYVYVQNLLVDYIKREQQSGYELDVIEKALRNYGHHPSMIHAAVKAVKEGTYIDAQPEIRLPRSLVVGFITAAFLIFIIYMSYATGTGLGTVVFAFTPSVVGISVVFVIFSGQHEKNIVRLLPLAGVFIAVAGFLLLLQISASLRSMSEPQTIILLNAVIAFLSSAMICLLSTPPPKRVTVKEIEAEAKKVG